MGAVEEFTAIEENWDDEFWSVVDIREIEEEIGVEIAGKECGGIVFDSITVTAVDEINREKGLGHGFNDVVETMLSSPDLVNKNNC